MTLRPEKTWMVTPRPHCVTLGSAPMKTMVDAMNATEPKPKLTAELENVVTIDGRGRPKKAKLFLELVEEFGIEAVMEELKKFSERKFF
jgi:thioredoxin reductase